MESIKNMMDEFGSKLRLVCTKKDKLNRDYEIELVKFSGRYQISRIKWDSSIVIGLETDFAKALKKFKQIISGDNNNKEES